MINESNITNNERLYRNFISMIKSYKPNVDIDTVCVEKTSKGNWKAYDANGRKICLISKFILNDAVVDEYKIKKCEK